MKKLKKWGNYGNLRGRCADSVVLVVVEVKGRDRKCRRSKMGEEEELRREKRKKKKRGPRGGNESHRQPIALAVTLPRICCTQKRKCRTGRVLPVAG